ncbi:MAG: D-sedoheptulose 7-phosphate isomerase [Hydrotalea sp.]|nr:D-sedoheptulose 7-phosphate isomerase [Hydrotalea sp.]
MPAIRFENYCRTVAQNMDGLQRLAPTISAVIGLCIQSLTAGNKIIFIGNGGSAADSQHLSAELIGRYKKNRPSIAAIALTTDTSAITAIANDFGYDEVFARQLAGLGDVGDVLFALSTSGNSANILRAISVAKEMGIAVVGMTGAGGGKMAGICNHLINVPSPDTNHIQEMHITVGHFICGEIEEAFATQPKK